MKREVISSPLLLIGWLFGRCLASLPDLHYDLSLGFGGGNESKIGETIEELQNPIQYNFVETNPERSDGENEETTSEDLVYDVGGSLRDIILNLVDSADDRSEVSIDLRFLIMERRTEYMEELDLARINDEKLPHPKKLLHFLAPKIPAIRYSKDATLKIRVGHSEIDSGLAASLIGTLAVACREYDEALNQSSAVYSEIVGDRKFAQVVGKLGDFRDVPALTLRQMECLLCAVDTQNDRGIDFRESEGANEVTAGLSILDCCRASWAVSAFLDSGANCTGFDQVQALAARASDLLQQNLVLLETGDIHASGNQTLDVQIRGLSGRLAKCAAASLWTFAQCVKGDVKFPSLVQTCSLCLICDPIDMRKSAQDAGSVGGIPSIGSNDVIERLAVTETIGDTTEDRANVTSRSDSDVLIYRLSAGDMKDIVLSLALHGVNSSQETQSASGVLQELAFDRVLSLLRQDLAAVDNRCLKNSGTDSSVIERRGSSLGGDEHTETLSAAEVLENEMETVHSAEFREYPSWNSLLSAEDLCSIAWATTELNDPLHSSIVLAIAELLFKFGPSSLTSCQGRHIADLVWSFAKVKTSGIGDYSIGTKEAQVSGWAIDVLKSKLTSTPALENVLSPPELSRLLWSLAVIYVRQPAVTPITTLSDSDLAELGLNFAIDHTDVFSCEDLARIVWAFSVLCDGIQVTRENPLIAIGLGKIVCRIEEDLLNWERCDSSSRDVNTPQRRHSVSFLGKAKIRFPFLDQKLDDFHEEEQSCGSRSRLPLLRDLPVDPLTLCKTTCAVRELFGRGNQADETLTRISLRLFVSRHGRLMSESPIEDLVHPAKVAATSLSTSRELVGHFTRVFLSLLNSSDKQLSLLHPFDVAEIMLALGHLGVKHTTENATTKPAHRRLRLFASLPCFSQDELEHLPNKALLNMLSGLTTLTATEVSCSTIGHILEILEGRVETLSGKCMIQYIACLPSFHSSATQSPGMTDKEDAVAKLLAQYEQLLTLISFHFAPLVPSLDTPELTDAMMHLVAARSPRDEIVLGIETEVEKRVSAMSQQHRTAPKASITSTAEGWVETINREQFALGRCAELVHSYHQKFKKSVGKD